MTCEDFLSLPSGDLTPEALEHIRDCEDCMNASAGSDPLNLFRALGGVEINPPEGTDAFVAGVMQQVRSEERRRSLTPQRDRGSRLLRWSAAAAVAAALLTYGLSYRPADVSLTETAVQQRTDSSIELAQIARPVVETYAGAHALIVEMPSTGDDIQLVMIFDESLPVDL